MNSRHHCTESSQVYLYQIPFKNHMHHYFFKKEIIYSVLVTKSYSTEGQKRQMWKRKLFPMNHWNELSDS